MEYLVVGKLHYNQCANDSAHSVTLECLINVPVRVFIYFPKNASLYGPYLALYVY